MPSITDSIGRVLGDRYRLVTALGTGASAHVYLADDVSLHRRVAIKVLHPALNEDASFLRRFRAEARAVAALNHPNILQVYDWGEDSGGPYLVLEYLSGGSLRQILDSGVLLTPAQAVALGRSVLAGLVYAHRRGFVHRDVKPANLLFDADGRVRIADFGLARAIAEAAWTEPEGTVLGTARYASPEQAEARAVDGRADVYALALVLYEAVTGTVPFSGESTVSTLMARVGTLLPEHPALGELYDVLVWAAAPRVEERYDAEELDGHLAALAKTLPDPEPLPMIDVLSVPAGSVAAADLTEPVRAGGGRGGTDTESPPSTGTNGRPTATGASRLGEVEPAVDGVFDEEGRGPGSGTRSHRRRWPWVVAVVVLLAALGTAAGAWAAKARVFTPSHPVPNLVGKTLPAATKAVRADHFTVRQTGLSYSTTTKAGIILSQSPAPSPRGHAPVTRKEGATIDVVVSRGLPPVTIPNLTSFTSCKDAVAALQAVHLVGTCPQSAARYSDTVAAGGILGSVPTGSALYGSSVTIIVSKGHAPVSVPAVTGTGSTYDSAVAALKAAGFVPTEKKEYSSSVPATEVIGTDPAPSSGPQPFGSTVTVVVSLGPQPVPVPSLVGLSVPEATAKLHALGLKVSGVSGPPGATTVAATSPAAGTDVLPGTGVWLDTL